VSPLAPAVACAALLLASAGRDGSAQPGPELAHVKQLGAALSEYNDGNVHAVAAYYYSQRNHDSAWVLVELGFNSQRAVQINRDRIELATPSGDVVPLSGHRRWALDATRATRLLQQVRPTRHQVRSYFKEIADITRLRFFIRPDDRGTIVDAMDSTSDQVLLGDLFFESPTGAWERGRYVLAIGHARGVAQLPIELR
jgi:hypothetical protein